MGIRTRHTGMKHGIFLGYSIISGRGLGFVQRTSTSYLIQEKRKGCTSAVTSDGDFWFSFSGL